jgi:hypothetical protein
VGIFLYLCYHDGGILDVPTLSRELDGINRQSVNNFLDLFDVEISGHGHVRRQAQGAAPIP